MPSYGEQGEFWESDPRRWERCRQAIAAEMVAQGWNRHACKFAEVQYRRARKLFTRKVG